MVRTELPLTIGEYCNYLRECPKVFFDPDINGTAIIMDTFVDLDWIYPMELTKIYDLAPIPQKQVFLIICWLLHHPEILKYFRVGLLTLDQQRASIKMLDIFLKVAPLALLVNTKLFLSDQDRREELTRIVLDLVLVLPKGESEAVFKTRMISVDTISEQELLKASEAERKRAEAVMLRLKQAEAEAAAAKVSRE